MPKPVDFSGWSFEELLRRLWDLLSSTQPGVPSLVRLLPRATTGLKHTGWVDFASSLYADGGDRSIEGYVSGNVWYRSNFHNIVSAQNELASFFHAWRFKSERLLRYAFFLVRRELEELRARTGMDATDASDDDEEGGNEAYPEDSSFDPPSRDEGLPKYPWPKRPHKPPPMPLPHPPAPLTPPSCPPVSPAQPPASRGTGGGGSSGAGMHRTDWLLAARSL